MHSSAYLLSKLRTYKGRFFFFKPTNSMPIYKRGEKEGSGYTVRGWKNLHTFAYISGNFDFV